MPPNLEPGAVVGGRYRLVGEIGRGAIGVVWEAEDLTTHEAVAVKVLQSSAQSALGRLRREAGALLGLRHAGIVRVEALVEEEAIAAVVMELLVGRTLRDRLESDARPDARETMRIGAAVAEAVGFVHANGIIHRDLKPENIFLVAEGGRVVVLDFGLAKWLEPAQAMPGSVVTELGTRLGTLPYMAPEQVISAPVDGAVDAWSLGVVLHECFAGFRPFEADDEPRLLRRILLDAIAPLALSAPEIAPPVASLVDRLLSREPRDRLAALAEAPAVLREHAGSPS